MTKEAARKLKREHRTKGVRTPTGDVSSRPRARSTEQECAGHFHLQDSHSLTSNETRTGSITHRTLHASPRTLEQSIAAWLINPSGIQRRDDLNTHSPTRPESVPVMLVALHACGSLTVDVLRTFLSNRARDSQAKDIEHAWTSHSLVVVGCCYNLMSPSGMLSILCGFSCRV